MHCPSCHTANREGRRFCAECGAPLAVACPNCDILNEPGDKFCGGCGAALLPTKVRSADDSVARPHDATRRPPDATALSRESSAERRQVTVMFCDLVGSTELSERLDPEDMREVLRAYQGVCAEVISHFGGFLARYMGDGVLVHFGYPAAYEDAAERAVRVGLAIIDEVRRLGQRLGQEKGVEPAVRVGIATGLVVAGDLIGSGVAEEQAVVGETPNLAARLQGLAAPNTVVIAPNTYRLLGGLFEYEDLGCHRLKGFSEPVTARRVVRPKLAASRFDAAHPSGVTALVGREAELELLRRRWEQAKSGEGQVVMLSGEAGIGKSRLIQTFREQVSDEPHTRLRYQCSPYHTNSALYPFTSQIEAGVKFAHGSTVAERLDRLEAFLAQVHDRVDELAPLFASLLSIPTGDRYPPLELTPQQQKERLFDAFIELMEGVAEKHLVLVVFEDAHWMDPTSRALLDSIVTRAATARVLVLITFRSDFPAPWSGPPHVGLISLSRLNHRERVALVERVTDGMELPPEVVAQIVDNADGVPLFIEELTRTILDSGLLTKRDNRYVVEGPLPPLAIPTTLQDSLMARLDKLAPVKEVAQIGAVIGREFSYDLLAMVSDLNDIQLRDSLEHLAAAELVFLSRRGRLPGAHYVFKHALVQNAAYESLLKSRRQQLHARIAKILEESYPERVQIEPELLAYHYTAADLPEPAVAFWARAGQRALERAANLEVIGHITKGLQVLSRLPEGADRVRRECEFHIALGAAYRATRGFASSDAERSFIRARELCERIPGHAHLVDVLRGLYACYYARGELGAMGEQANRVMALGADSGDANCRMVGHWMLGAKLFWQGAFPAAREEFQQAFALYDPGKVFAQSLSAQIDPGVNALIHLGWTQWILGYPEQAVRTSEEALLTARKLVQPFTVAMALAFACWTRLCCGHVSVTETLASELGAVTREHGFLYLGTCATIIEGQALIARQDEQAGLKQVRRALSDFEAQEAGLGWPYALAALVAGYARVGDAEQGLDLVSQALSAVETHGERHWEAELHRLEGELLSALPDDRGAQAESCLRRAMEVAQAQEAKSLELRAAMSLARLLEGEARGDEAKRVLAGAYGWFSEGFDTVDLRAAEKLLSHQAAS